MIRKTAPLAVIFGLVCVALILPQFIELGQAQDEPPGPTSPQDESLRALNRPVAELPAPVEKTPATGGQTAPALPVAGPTGPAVAPRLPSAVRSSDASATAPTITYGAGGTPGPGPQPAVQASSNQTGGMMGQAEQPSLMGGGMGGGMMGGDMSGDMSGSGMMGSGMMGSGMMGSGMMGSDMMGSDMMGATGPMGPSGPQFQQRLAEETQKLLQATTPEEKQQATEALGRLLGEYFDSDMQRRQADLDKVRERVARLEELLSKRQAAKQEIIDLQLKTMVNESEGLGFFSTPAPGQPGMPGIDLFGRPQFAPGMGMPGMGEMPGTGMQ